MTKNRDIESFLRENKPRVKDNPTFMLEVQQKMRAVGYRQAIDYLLGEIDYDRFLIAGVAATRQLAKRQMTWMRSMDDIHLMDPLTEDVVVKALTLIKEAQAR